PASGLPFCLDASRCVALCLDSSRCVYAFRRVGVWRDGTKCMRPRGSAQTPRSIKRYCGFRALANRTAYRTTPAVSPILHSPRFSSRGKVFLGLCARSAYTEGETTMKRLLLASLAVCLVAAAVALSG